MHFFSKFLVSIRFFQILILAWFAGCGGAASSSDNSEPVYAVIYDANGAIGGTVPEDGAFYRAGQIVTIAGNSGVLVCEGYKFTGWNTKADRSGITYTPGQNLTVTGGNVVLYAQWSNLVTHSVIYDANGATSGSVPVDTTSYEAGQKLPVSGNAGELDYPGFSFSGWNTAANGSGVTYTQGQEMTVEGNMTLYALWIALPTYTVTYYKNGSIFYTTGTTPSDTTHYYTGQTVTVLANTGNLSQKGSLFFGWNTKSDGTGVNYQPGDSFLMGSSGVSLYARWGKGVYYDANGATSGYAPFDGTEYAVGQAVIVIGNPGVLAKTNAVFAGWNTKADGTGTTYTEKQAFVWDGSNVTLYALWKYSVTYYSNYADAGSVPVDTALYSPGETVTVLPNAGELGKEYYTFEGWSATAAYTSASPTYVSGQTIIVGSTNIDLYARWSGKWSGVGTGCNYGTTVNAVDVDSFGNIYIGGSFTSFNGISINRLAKYTAETGTWGMIGGGIGDSISYPCINAIAIDADDCVYIGGELTRAGSVTVGNIARWDPAKGTWSSLGSGVSNPSGITRACVNCITVDPMGNVYVGGYFTYAGGVTVNHIAKWDPKTMTWSALGAGLSGSVYSIAVDQSGNVYAGGCFEKIYNSISVNHVAKWNPVTGKWAALGSGVDGSVDGIAIDKEGDVYIAGHCYAIVSEVHPWPMGDLFKWNVAAETWSSLGGGCSWGGSKFVIDGSGRLFAGGGFEYDSMYRHAGPSTDRVALYDPIGDCWIGLGSGMNSGVSALAFDASGNLYVVGSFDQVAGFNCRGFAVLKP